MQWGRFGFPDMVYDFTSIVNPARHCSLELNQAQYSHLFYQCSNWNNILLAFQANSPRGSGQFEAKKVGG